MRPPRPLPKRIAASVVPVLVGLLTVSLVERPVLATPDLQGAGRVNAINLNLDHAAATRVMADLSQGTPSGAAQEADTEKPRSMEEQEKLEPGKKPAPTAVKKEAPPPDTFAFVHDWPFWVIVGGVVIAAAAGYMLLRNSNQESPCAPQFSGNCLGAR